MTNPLERLETYQSLKAQQEADLKVLEEKKLAKAAELFKPISEAFEQLAAADIEVWEDGSPTHRKPLRDFLDHGVYRRAWTIQIRTRYQLDTYLLVDVPDAGKVVWDDKPFLFSTGQYGPRLEKAVRFENHEQLLDYAMKELAPVLKKPEKKPAAKKTGGA